MTVKTICEYFNAISGIDDIDTFKAEAKKIIATFLYYTAEDMLEKYKISEESDDIVLIHKKDYEDFKKKLSIIFGLYTEIDQTKEKTDIDHKLYLISAVANSENFCFDMENTIKEITKSKVNMFDRTNEKIFLINMFEKEIIEFIKAFLRVLDLIVRPYNNDDVYLIEDYCFRYYYNSLRTIELVSFEIFTIFDTDLKAFSNEDIYNFCKATIIDTKDLENLYIELKEYKYN